MFNYEYHATTTAGRVCLEISLKPFGYDKTKAGCEKVARDLFTQWASLLKRSTGCSVLFWTSDGSEILDFSGRLSDTFEWCKYIGIGNWDRNLDPETVPEPRRSSLHLFPMHYMENPPEMSYEDLKTIITAIKEVGREITGFDNIEVGETFDPGPEFAYSPFKYERHTEISVGNIMGCKRWVHCASRLHADDRQYAAYPNGIPEGTHLGTFLGKQFMALAKAVGFDYIWLSNGFGYSLASWNWTGEIFDGQKYDFSGAAKVRENIAEFWKYFSEELGDTRVETRGSNLSTGMDIAAHGCPIDEIYKQNTVAPPNSPWAPLDYRFGLELAGFMTHIAELPKLGFNIRYYIHDPWWLNSPWFDRYDRSPHDIYLPIALGRLDEKGEITHNFGLSFLSADDSFGRLPDRCPNEVIPHLLTAFEDLPDAAGLVTWVYPFDAYCKTGLYEGHPERVMMDDWYVESAVDMGFPVNTVISDNNFVKIDKEKLSRSILFTPVPEADSDTEKALFDAIAAGSRVILYGSTKAASDRLKKDIGVTYADEIDGTLDFSTTLTLDKAEIDTYSNKIIHPSLLSNGGIGEVADGSTVVAAKVAKDGTERAYVTYNKDLQLVWIRGSFPHNEHSHSALPSKLTPSGYFPTAVLTRAAMELFGYGMTFDCYSVNDNLPIVQYYQCRGAMYYNLFAKDASVIMHFTTPEGTPAFDNTEFTVENSVGTYPLSRWIHTDCRMYVKQDKRSKICVKKDSPVCQINTDEDITVSGLVNADVTFYPPKGGVVTLFQFHTASPVEGVTPEFDEKRGCYIFRNLTGRYSFKWQCAERIGDYKKLEFIRKVK